MSEQSFFMALSATLMLMFIVSIRIILNCLEEITSLKAQVALLEEQLEIEKIPAADRDIIFDNQGGYRIVNKNDKSETVSLD